MTKKEIARQVQGAKVVRSIGMPAEVEQNVFKTQFKLLQRA